MKELFKNKLFMALTASDIISNLGDSLFYLAIMNYVLSVPNTELAISLISISEFIPMLTGVITGDWADQTKNKVRTIISTQIFRVVIYIIIGFLMSFNPALWIIIVLSILNFLSDIAGQYESSLFIPLSLIIVPNELRETSIGFKQSLSASTRIVFLTIGGALVMFLSYQNIAWLNALTFLASALIMMSVWKPLRKLQVDVASESLAVKTKTTFIVRVKKAINNLKDYPEVMRATMIFCFINGSFSVLNTFLIVMMDHNQQFIIQSSELTIALIPILLLVGNIVGAVFGLTLFKKLSLMQESLLGITLGVVMYVGFMVENIYIVCAFLFLSSVVAGAIGPKFNAMVMNNLPQETLAMTIGGLNTILTMGIVIIGGSVSIAINLVSIKILILVVLIFSLCVMIYLMIKEVDRHKVSKAISYTGPHK